ncbi:alkaline phosphatase family protein [Pengzhenrongella frigida]|uniref:Alkaline phosphatase family protein n=1 Tax=Pengzhenrongella frigida TaxID=1259133 RepID=A0A4Q5MXH9_9MICO|nr:nucleotide pyrophosphatase/phosphodiesterase family protein [Cellulomonas sp. HLT2-17]RYV50340.1 alkaline phosphatase family protein [Cellulomonas sp. HLT2-17]
MSATGSPHVATEPLAPLEPTQVDGFARAGFVSPQYDGAGLGAVLPAVADALGVEVTVDGRSGARARATLGLPNAKRACVVLIDGLGHSNLSERSGHAPFLRSLLADGQVLTAGFPSTTAASIGLFGTGTGPGRTAMVGYTARNPATGGLANLVSWQGAGDPRDWQHEPTLFESVAAAGIPVTTIGPAKFAGSGLTEAALRGGGYHRAERLDDRIDATVYELMGPALVYLYWGDVDKVGHHHGWGSWQWGDELTAIDRELARLERSLPPDTLLIVTADHGMVDVDRSQRWDVARTPALADGVELIAGEPRALHVHTLPDAPGGADEVAARWRATLGDAAVVATRDEAIGAGWFGPVSDHVRSVLGDVVVAMAGRATVVDSRTQTSGSMDLVGVHGSFTPEEMHVPLLMVHRR